MTPEPWPALPYDAWKDTSATLRMWARIVFILPYEAVRSAASPERAIMEFVDSTHTTAATLGNWDRAALEAVRARGRGNRR
jgi:hypothetical protein